MIQITFSSVQNNTFSLSFRPASIGFLRLHSVLKPVPHVFRIFLKQHHTFRKRFLFQLHDKLLQNLVAYTDHFILLMILWVTHLGRTHLGHCFHMALTGPGGSTAMMASSPAFLVPLCSLASPRGSVILQGFSTVVSV